MTLFAGCMRTSPERALRTPPSFSMEGPALGDPHTPLPWLLPPPPPQREGGEAGLAAPLRVLESRHVGEGGVDCRYADARVMKSVSFVADAPFWADVSFIETLFDICVVN
jgi:hypothetical protein